MMQQLLYNLLSRVKAITVQFFIKGEVNYCTICYQGWRLLLYNLLSRVKATTVQFAIKGEVNYCTICYQG